MIGIDGAFGLVNFDDKTVPPNIQGLRKANRIVNYLGQR